MFPLRIYTALKHGDIVSATWEVCFPYEFTLLSNLFHIFLLLCAVCFPYEFTLLSNTCASVRKSFWFVSPTNLHCSQTERFGKTTCKSLFPLRIYTALKQTLYILGNDFCLFPLRIYTALKPRTMFYFCRKSLFPLRIYTALKRPITRPLFCVVCFPYEFTLLSNLFSYLYRVCFVCFPYEFTLLSNDLLINIQICNVCFPYEFTLLSNLKPQIAREKYLRNICVTFIVYWKHFYFNIKYIDLHPL